MAFMRSPVRSRSGPPTFIPTFNRPQVAEGRCGYGGPEVRRARQNAFCERQDALYIEFIELA